MHLTLFTMFGVVFLISDSQGWLAPERCAQNTRSRRSADQNSTAGTQNSIQEIINTQNARLEEQYRNSKFFSIPISAKLKPKENDSQFDGYYAYGLSNCSFYTHRPQLIASVNCQQGITCTLARSVSTLDTYTASEGYNWGVKISTKLSITGVFEVGGEVSVGGTYTCSYTKGKTVTDNVSCTDTNSKGKILQLYKVKTDMKCLYGRTTFVAESRNGSYHDSSLDFFTAEEIHQLLQTRAALYHIYRHDDEAILVDVDELPDEIYRKIKRRFPDYNPYTDPVVLRRYWINPNNARVYYYRPEGFEEEYEKIIPFTDEYGNSVYQYACTSQ